MVDIEEKCIYERVVMSRRTVYGDIWFPGRVMLLQVVKAFFFYWSSSHWSDHCLLWCLKLSSCLFTTLRHSVAIHIVQVSLVDLVNILQKIELILRDIVVSVEEAKKRMYACSTTTYNGFQAVMTEEMSEKFRGKFYNCFLVLFHIWCSFSVIHCSCYHHCYH